MTFEKLFGYAFLITIPLVFLEKTVLLREYYQPISNDNESFMWMFFGMYCLTNVINKYVSIMSKKK